jgi:membrane protease YdiL (CAAX protease family)
MHDKESFIDFDFDHLKEPSWPLVTVAVLVDVVVLLIAMQVVLPLLKSSFPVERLTNGLVQATLIFSIVRFALVIVCVIVLVGGLKARDVGLQWQKLPSGALVVFGVWIVMQIVGMLPGLVASGQVALSSYWTWDRVPAITGELIAQFLGNAFVEEVIFRGFLATQVYLMLKAWTSGQGRLLTAAVLVSQLIFALSHIPQRIAAGYSPLSVLLDLLVVWVTGILFAVLYLRTGNIFIAVGVHALVNAPVTVVALPSQATAKLLLLILSLLLILVWGPLIRWVERRVAAQPA